MSRGVAGSGPAADAGPDPERAAERDEALVAALRDEILRDGPIPFARFMEAALYDPERGYYRTAEHRAGRDGDFLTAPEASPLFGRTVARTVEDAWRRLGEPDPFVVREFGAGSGALAAGIVDGLIRAASPLLGALRYEPVEANPHRIAELTRRLDALRPGLPVVPVPAWSPGSATGPSFAGIVLANEFVDALPVHVFEWRSGEPLEVRVAWRDGWFAEELAPPEPAVARYLDRVGSTPAEAVRGEVCIAMAAWLADLAAQLERGWLLLIDYGLPAAELRGATRPRGTLKGSRAQRVEPDVYRSVGRQDLTAHVDLTGLDLDARDAGFEPAGSAAQGRYLAAAGMGELLVPALEETATVNERLEARSAAMWLLDPRRTGGFAVRAYGRNAPPGPLLGLE